MTAKKTKSPKAAKAAKPAAKKTAAPKVKAEAASKDQRNGITRPSAEGKCGQVWAALDAMVAAGKDTKFEALREAINSKIADATIRTQRQRWNKYRA
jgi:chromatin remodeling complex protein RSC6